MIDPGAAHCIDLVAFPVFVIVNLALGITSVLPDWKLTRHDRANPAALARLIERHGVTRLLVPPSICEKLAIGPALPQVTKLFTGGGPVFPDLLRRLADKLPNAEIISVYGSTEAEPIAHLSMAEIAEADWQAMESGGGLLAGRPIPEIAIALIDDEIVVSGAHVNQGYLDGVGDAVNKLRRDGRIWHRTGDAGRFDATGRLWLLGRHEARAGGFYPFSIEVAARFWPGVRRAALIDDAGRATLVIEGERAHEAFWIGAASSQGAIRVVPVTRIPLDRRHRSKVDYAALRRLLA
jgi:acyl-CoA synthetase (AMP-forming)/AMP-acid ligase II